MRSLLGASRLPDDATIPEWLLYYALTPIRLYRQRTSVQLVISYVTMLFLTVLLLVAGVVAIVWWPRIAEIANIEDITLDYGLGEKARSYAWWLDPDALAATMSGTPTSAEIASLQQSLAHIVQHDVTGFEGPISDGHAFQIAHVAIVNLDGMVVASDDPEWAANGTPFSRLDLESTRSVVARTLVLAGATDPTWGTLYSLQVEHERTSASYPLITRDGTMVGVIVLEGNPIRSVIGGESKFGLVSYFLGQLRYVLVLIIVPAIVVAIPFGVWRARSMSRRPTPCASM